MAACSLQKEVAFSENLLSLLLVAHGLGLLNLDDCFRAPLPCNVATDSYTG